MAGLRPDAAGRTAADRRGRRGSPEAFAAALPVADFDGWRAYLGRSGCWAAQPVAAWPVRSPCRARSTSPPSCRSTPWSGCGPAQPLLEPLQGRAYTWSPASDAAADRRELVARAPEFGDTPVRLVVGADDHPEAIVAPARELATALTVGDLVELPGLAHPLTDEPGVAPAPQWELTREVDRLASGWLTRHAARRSLGRA